MIQPKELKKMCEDCPNTVLYFLEKALIDKRGHTSTIKFFEKEVEYLNLNKFKKKEV